ncbi:MAG: class I SAM-dependent methyltransferase [Sulfuricella sp.]|jgi:ubiquinone/menaquinone biosynthesis C-methylase UbiE
MDPLLRHRIPEPELMNDPMQARAYAEADFSEPHQAFVTHFQRLFPDFSPSQAIDLGCGPADVTLRFARAFPESIILGVDGASAMLALGRQAVEAEGLARRLRLQQSYLPDTLLPASNFDAVISNSLLHHLDDPAVLWQTVRHVARPGAAVLVMDLKRPASIQEARGLAIHYAADAPPILQHDFYHSLLAAYRPDEVRLQLDGAGLSQLRVEAVSDRHVLIWGIMDV